MTLHDHWLPHLPYVRSLYGRAQHQLEGGGNADDIGALVHELCRLARRAGYVEVCLYRVLFASPEAVVGDVFPPTETNSYLSHSDKSGHILSGAARTSMIAGQVRTELERVREAYLDGADRRRDERD